MSPTSSRCFCGSGLDYADCCEPLHLGNKKAQTAEQLMRSRYSAFCTKNADYLIATHHSSKRKNTDKVDLERNFATAQWLGLNIVATEKGLANDEQGVVEFDARFMQNNAISSLREASQFVKENGQWYYLEGALKPIAQNQKLGRNDACYCGSGKKFKKCHGA